MIKSRLFVVDKDTLDATTNDCIAKIYFPKKLGDQWDKTISDIMADLFQIEIGDYIFLWETKSKGKKSCIYGVWRAISKPFYEIKGENDDKPAPFKICIERAYEFKNPIDEYDVLNNPYSKSRLWTIIGKKVAGKSRGTIPLSIEESKDIITQLIAKNNCVYNYLPFDKSRIKSHKKELCLNLNKNKNLVNKKPSKKFLNLFNPNKLNFLDNGNVRKEKVLETIFNYNLSNRNHNFFSLLGINVDKVIWFSNYLPYSIEASEMDYVIIESDDGINLSKIFVIEFIKNRIDKDHINRALMYSKWVNETLCLGCNIVTPMIVCFDSPDFLSKLKSKKQRELNQFIQDQQILYNVQNLQIFTYNFNNSSIFVKKR